MAILTQNEAVFKRIQLFTKIKVLISGYCATSE